MNGFAKGLVVFVIIFHVTAFVVETFLWMRPAVHEPLLGRLAIPVALNPHDQALVLKGLFVNQGFYNLFLALAGVTGFVCLAKGRATIGYTLISYMCLSAAGAGLVLAVSSGAYVGAFLQAVPAAVALALMWRASDVPVTTR